MKTGKNTVVTLTYTLRTDNEQGEIVETVDEKNPATFLIGVGSLLEKFEENLSDLSPGEKFAFGLTSEEGYGQAQDEAVVDVPLKAFEVEGKIDTEMLQLGNFLPMRDMEGNLMHGKVTNVGEEFVTMDFNHPLAGKDLFFSGAVVDVREASAEEIEHRHVHDPEGHDH